MAKRSKSTEDMISAINSILALDELYVTIAEDGKRVDKYVSSDSVEGMTYKQGICDAIEIILHKTDSYRGFIYLDTADLVNKKFNRKYF